MSRPIRPITTLVESAVDEPVVSPIFLFFADFPSGAIRAWTGYGTLEWQGEEWLGTGELLSVSELVESSDTSVKEVVVTMTSLDPTLIGALDEDNFHNREGKIWFGLIGSNGVINDPYLMFEGRLDSDETIFPGREDGNATVSIKATDYLGDLLRPRIWRYTHEDQQALHPGENDLGLEFVPQLQDLQINWGKASNATARGTGGQQLRGRS